MKNRILEPEVLTSVKVPYNLYIQVKENHIKIVDCVRAGASLMLAEKGLIEYDNNLNLMRRLKKVTEELEKVLRSQEIKQNG